MGSLLGGVSFLIMSFDLANLENLLHMKSGAENIFLPNFWVFIT